MKEPRRKIIPVFVPHLGCPHECVFCNQRHISGAGEPASAVKTAHIVREALNKTGPGAEVAFYGGSFTAVAPELQEELLSAVQPFRRSLDVTGIRVSTRPDCVDAESLRRIERFGVTTVELGAQSMDDEVLRLSERGHESEAVRTASRLVKGSGFSLILQMMTGLPGDTRGKAAYSARELASLEPDGVRIYPTVVVRDTQLAKLWMSGAFDPQSPQEAALWCADLLEIFEECNIPVIRLGLNPTDELTGGEVLAGAYHPALGELARGEFYLRKVERLLGESCGRGALNIYVPKGMVSVVTGQRRRNIESLKRRFGFRDVWVREDAKTEKIYICCL